MSIDYDRCREDDRRTASEARAWAAHRDINDPDCPAWQGANDATDPADDSGDEACKN